MAIFAGGFGIWYLTPEKNNMSEDQITVDFRGKYGLRNVCKLVIIKLRSKIIV